MKEVITITLDEFDHVSAKALEKMTEGHELNGMSAFLIPMTGMLGIKTVRDLLFGEEDDKEEKKEEPRLDNRRRSPLDGSFWDMEM